MDLTSARETTRMDLTSAPEYFNFAEDVLGICAQHYPERTAILALDERGHEIPWSFGALHEQSARLAHVLQARGLARGNIAMLMIASQPHGVLARLAVMKAGGVSLLVRSRATEREIAHYLERAAPRLAIAGAADADRVPAGLPRLVIPSPALDRALDAAPADFPSLPSAATSPSTSSSPAALPDSPSSSCTRTRRARSTTCAGRSTSLPMT